MSSKNQFGDMQHLLIFRTNPGSYQILLDAAIQVITERETLMPITAADLFQRHLFLGGKLKRLILANDNSTVSKEELRHLYKSPWKTTPAEASAFRLVKEFLAFSVTQGDSIRSPAILATGHEIDGYVLKAKADRTNPKIGEMSFYSQGLKTSYKNGDHTPKDLDHFLNLAKRNTNHLSEEQKTALTIQATAEYYKTNNTELFGKHRAAHILRARKMIVYILAEIVIIERQKVADVFSNKKANVASTIGVFSDHLLHATVLQEELADILALIVKKTEESSP